MPTPKKSSLYRQSRLVAVTLSIGSPHEIGLRIDWGKPDGNGDPTLDADFFNPGETKPLQQPLFKSVHHTRKTQESGLWIYDFAFDDLHLRLLIEFTRQQNISAVARIVRPESNSNQHPEHPNG
jgi:hypothetical protein